MKKIKKMFAVVLSAVMVLAMALPIMAAAPSGARTLDSTISITGLDNGDVVNLYKVIKWDDGWKAADGFTSLTDAEVIEITGKAADNTTTPPTAAVPGKITSTMAGKLGGMITGVTAKYGPLTAASGKIEVSTPEAGLYMAIITPATANVSYNPVFVAADYDQPASGNTNTWAVDLTKSYSDKAMAKKSTIPVKKEPGTVEPTYADQGPNTHRVGDTVTYVVNTTIPKFASNYTNPKFDVTDKLTPGLELDTATVEVYKGTYSKDTIGTAPAADKLTAGTEYTDNDPAATKSGYTLKFKADYLKGLAAAQEITITYKAKVTSAAITSVNIEKNEITINFSNSPTENKGALKDITNHYTFNIDGNLLGDETYKVTEVVKVGVDKDGKEITETRTLSNGHKVGALQGAEFKLYVYNATDEAPTWDGNDLSKLTAYTNDYMTANDKIVSDIDGRLTVEGAAVPGIRGLDAGTYYLVETKAPDGYIKYDKAVKIEITATLAPKTYNDVVTIGGEDIPVTYQADELTGYVVKIDGKTTASYTMTNQGPDKADTVIGPDTDDGKIKNPQGVELPSTGGVGTTIFYAVGAALVIGAGVILVTRRRMDAK